MYPEKTTDKIMIPQWEYRRLRDIATRVDVVLGEMEADQFLRVEDIKRILAPHRENPAAQIETADDLADVLDYTE